MAIINNALNNASSTSVASSTQTFTISNSDNTSTSDAMLQISVGGSGTSGDAYNSFVVTGASTWTSGVDNSDSDNFVISANAALGTTNTFVMNTSGVNTLPLQPSFSVYPDATISNVTGGATNYVTNFNTEIFDRSGNNTSTTFTAPVTGRYCITGTITLSELTGGTGQQNMQFVTSNRNYLGAAIRTATVMDVNTALSNSMTRLIDMDAADTATMSIIVVGGAVVVDVLGGTAPIQSIRSGFLAS